jgi:hypothetical protein
MTETVVHVTTLEQWKSVLDVCYKNGHYWLFTNTKYNESIFEDGGRFLNLDDYITYSRTNPSSKPFIEYSEFMAQQKEDNKMETYYVKQEKLDLIQELKDRVFPLHILLTRSNRYEIIKAELSSEEEKALLRYLGGDKTIEFKVKDPLYQLSRIDAERDKVYMKFTATGNPDWTMDKDRAFTSPLEEIKKWQTPAWEIEKAD